MRKYIIGILLAVFVMGITPVPVTAAEPINFEPFWDNTQSIHLALSFSNGQANASSVIHGNGAAASITAIYTLQERVGNSWVTVHTWPEISVTGSMLTFTGTATAVQGRTYRLSVTTTVTSFAGVPETITLHHERTYR